MGFPGGSDGEESFCNAGDMGSIPGLGRFPWRREQLLTPVLWPGEFHGQRSLAGYSPWGCKESDTTEWLWRFLLRSKCLLISWLESPSAVILEPRKIKSVTVSIVSPSICHEVMGPDAMIFVFWILSLYQLFHSSLTLIKRLFSSSSLSVNRVVSDVVHISPSSLNSSLCFIQLSISHDVLCI